MPAMISQLLCRLGHHAPAADGLWNAGYCFTRCRRCGRNMVRSAFGEWHVPHAYRVVWRPPADGQTHRFAATARATPPEPASLPEQRIATPRPPVRRRDDGSDPFDFADLDAESVAAGDWRPSPHRQAVNGSPSR